MRTSNRRLMLAAAAALAFLIMPFVAVVIGTPWTHFKMAPGDAGAVAASIGYTLVALTVIVAIGTPLAYWLARYEFRGKVIVEGLVLLPLLTPPLAMGLMLAILYGPYGLIGRWASAFDIALTNTPAAFVLAQVYAAAPYFIIAARSAFETVDPRLERISSTLGRSRWQTFWRVSLPLARTGLAAGVAFAWVRALGEFGIVLIIAYFPQGIPVKLWVNLQDIGLSAVYPLLWIFFLVAIPLPLILGVAARRGAVWN